MISEGSEQRTTRCAWRLRQNNENGETYHSHTHTSNPESDTMSECEPTKELSAERKRCEKSKATPTKVVRIRTSHMASHV